MEFNEKQWHVVSENNSLCYGLCVIRKEIDTKDGKKTTIPIGLRRARLPGKHLGLQRLERH